MRRRLAFAAAGLLFAVSLALLIWQGSFRINYAPSDLSETIILGAVSILIFLLTVILAFMLFRAGVKVYIDRQRNKEGSHIRSKLLFGALVLTLAPALFFALFSGYVLNRHLDTWFNKPTRNIESAFRQMDSTLRMLDGAYRRESQRRIQAQTNWIGLLPETRQAAVTGRMNDSFFRVLCRENGIHQLVLERPNGPPMLLFQVFEKPRGSLLQASSAVVFQGKKLGTLKAAGDLTPVANTWGGKTSVESYIESQTGRRKFYQDTYFRLICLITVFVLFLASWAAQILSRQISVPISALLGAAREVRRGNLSYRVRVNAMDELATLVRVFNEMTNELDANSRELESRRRFTEAILESIPTGVISVSADERIERVNRALSSIFPKDVIQRAKRLDDLFAAEDLAEIRYLLNKTRRTGVGAMQLDIERPSSLLHLAVTAASLEQHRGFVLVLEDTSDLLKAQKTAAWQEVARRIAHEIKNPLTPISLSADRIARHLKRLPIESHARGILEECTATIQQEVQTVKSLVDEFSQFSRFPAAQLASAHINEIVENAMAVFAGRLEDVSISLHLEPSLPLVLADREQMKRVIVNLVDNAAEAMNGAPVRKMLIATRLASAYTVELIVADTGSGISAEDKEKLFLPYFSTKQRGTGLGLAIVNRIVTDHGGRVRVEDNHPSGARMIIELNALSPDSHVIEPLPDTLRV